MISIVCVLIASVLGAVGQFLFKTASDRATGGLASVLLSPWALAGMACYVTVMGFFTHAFRKGGTVTVLYPIYASTFIWAAVIALLLYGDPIRPVHVAGMILLVAGMYLMGL
jgi:multidrug transporter EmrE-like cation transporter